MACAALKRHVLVVAGMACAVALLLLILAASSARLETFKVKLTSDEFPQNDNLRHTIQPLQNAATGTAAVSMAKCRETDGIYCTSRSDTLLTSTSLAVHCLAFPRLAAIADAWSSDSLSALPLRDGDASEPSGWVKMALKLGYFRFCYEYKLHFDPFVSPSGNSSAQDAKVSGCQTIAHKCEFNLVWACTRGTRDALSPHDATALQPKRSSALCVSAHFAALVRRSVALCALCVRR